LVQMEVMVTLVLRGFLLFAVWAWA